MGVTASALHQMTAEEIGDLVASIGKPYTKYKKVIIKNGINGEFLSSLKDDTQFAVTFENLKIDSMHKVNLRQKIQQLRSAENPANRIGDHASTITEAGGTSRMGNLVGKFQRKSSRGFGSFTLKSNGDLLSADNDLISKKSSMFSLAASNAWSDDEEDHNVESEANRIYSGSVLAEMSPKAIDDLVYSFGDAYTNYKNIFVENQIGGNYLITVINDNQQINSLMKSIGIRNELHIMLILQRFFSLANTESVEVFDALQVDVIRKPTSNYYHLLLCLIYVSLLFNHNEHVLFNNKCYHSYFYFVRNANFNSKRT